MLVNTNLLKKKRKKKEKGFFFNKTAEKYRTNDLSKNSLKKGTVQYDTILRGIPSALIFCISLFVQKGSGLG